MCVASNGTIYWATINEYLVKKTFYQKKMRGYMLPFERAVDVNTKEDYELIKKIFYKE